MVAMFFSVHSRGWTPLLMAAFSAGSPNASKPTGKEDVLALHAVVAGDHVGRGFDEPVPMCRSPDG
jgi:hypothetical protein